MSQTYEGVRLVPPAAHRAAQQAAVLRLRGGGKDGEGDVEPPIDLAEQLPQEDASSTIREWLAGALAVNDGDPEESTDGDVDLLEDDCDASPDMEIIGARVVQPKSLDAIVAKLKKAAAPLGVRVPLIETEDKATSMDHQDGTSAKIAAMKSDPKWEAKQKRAKEKIASGGYKPRAKVKEANKPKKTPAEKAKAKLMKKRKRASSGGSRKSKSKKAKGPKGGKKEKMTKK
jgi:hypothetical protein